MGDKPFFHSTSNAIAKRDSTKYYDKKGNLLPAVCPFCGGEDSFGNFLMCRSAGRVPLDEEGVVSLLRGLALSIERVSPAQPRPIRPSTESEVILGWRASPEREISLSN